MSTISAVSSNTTVTNDYTTSSKKSASNTLDTNSFLTVLAAELKYQDPTDPVSATEYVSQQAQISSLSSLNDIKTSLNNYAAYSLIGKEATYSTTDSSGATKTGTGTVSAVTISGSNTYVTIGDSKVNLDSITNVESATTTTA